MIEILSSATYNSHIRESTVPALRRGFEVLQCFSEEHIELSVREIADQVDAPLASTYRIVRELTALGVLEPVDGGRFRLGLALARLGNLSLRGRELRSVALPVMQELAETVGETVLLLIRVGALAVCIEHIEGTYPIRPRSFGVGEQVDLWAGASALALFAFLPEEDRRNILDQSTRAPKDEQFRTRLENECEIIRRNGWCLTRDQVVVGTAAVASPILRRDSTTVVASLSLTGLTERIVDLEQAVTEAAKRIGDQLA